MTRLSVGQRIAASFVILILPVALIAMFFLRQQVTLFRQMQANQAYTQAEIHLLDAYSYILQFNVGLTSAVDRRDQGRTIELVDTFVFPDVNATNSTGVDHSAVAGLDHVLQVFLQYQAYVIPHHQKILNEIRDGNWAEAELLIDTLNVETDELKREIDRFSIVGVQVQSQQGLGLSPQNRIILLTAFSFGGIILLILVVGLQQTFTLGIPMSQLKHSLSVWQAGDFSHRAEVWGQGEIYHLGKMMNETVDLVEIEHGRMQEQIDLNQTSSHDLLKDQIFGLETNLAIAQHTMLVSDLDHILPKVVELLCQRYKLYHAAVYLIDKQTDLLVLEAGMRINDKRTLPINNKSLSGWAAMKERPGLSVDVTDDDRYYPSSKLPHTRSELALPLVVGGELYGVLDLHSDKKDGFTPNGVFHFQPIADLIGMAVRNVRMNVHVDKDGQKRSHLADALKEIGAELSATADLKDIFDLMLTHAKRVVEFDGAAVLVRSGKMLEVRSTIGDCLVHKGTKITPDPNDPLDIFMRIQEASQPYVLDRPEAMDVADKWRLLFLEGSWMAIPFVGKSNVAGIVSFSRHALEPFSLEDRSLALTVTNQSWLVLENTLLQQKNKRFQQQMEFELRSRTDAIQSAYADLEKLDETKSKFVTIASHELKTPLTIIRGYGEILQKQEKKSGGNPHNLRIVEGILKGVSRINELVENLLDLSRIDYRTLEITPEPIRLRDLLINVRAGADDALKLRNIQFYLDRSIGRLPIVDGDLVGLRKVFEHLINNAIKYTPDGGKIYIRGRSWMGGAPQLDWPDDGVQIQVIDTGIGIDTADQELIFQKFFQIGEADLHSTSKVGFRGGGPGLGLAIVRGIVTAHHGLVWAESKGEDLEQYPGTKMNIILPRRQKQNVGPAADYDFEDESLFSLEPN